MPEIGTTYPKKVELNLNEIFSVCSAERGGGSARQILRGQGRRR
jgi:hypothetical protein